MIFSKAQNTQAYLKAGLMGFAGSGKTFTGTEIAIGLVRLMKEKGLSLGEKPVFFLDTETGSDWVQPKFAAAGIELFTAKTRAFADLIPAILEAEKEGAALMIDSISHFWRELTESYAKKKNRTRGLEFQDWAWLKKEWGRFTDHFVNSNLHIIMCGRAGYEYDFFENDSGKRELEKTGVRMKAETETGYEPSILVLMEREMDLDSKKVYRTAHILKDRANLIDGKSFKNPTFETFRPHIEFLNIGGQQLGVDTSRTSEGMISADHRPEWKMEQEQREIILEKVQALFTKHLNTQTKEGRVKLLELLEKHFGTTSWKECEGFPLDKIKNAYNSLHTQLEGGPAFLQEAA